MNYVVIPLFNRPEFLHILIDRLDKVLGSDKNYYIFALEHGYDKNYVSLISKFNYHYQVLEADKKYQGNAYNLFTGINWALDRCAEHDLIHILEEDIMISEDYFHFHQIVHDTFDNPIVTAHQFKESKNSDITKLHEVKYTWNLGVSYKPVPLYKMMRTIDDGYYHNRCKYIREKFPDTGLEDLDSDGLLRRLIARENHTMLYPDIGRCYHYGYYGSNRPGKKPMGTYQTKATAILNMSDTEMNDRAYEYKDIQSIEFANAYTTTFTV